VSKFIDGAVTNASKSKAAAAFTDAYNQVQEKVNTGLASFLGGMKKSLVLPDEKTWIPSIIGQINKGMNQTRNQIQRGFDAVFGSGTRITVADSVRGAYDKAIGEINALASGPGWPKVTDQETRAGMVGPSLAPGLHSYLDTIKTRILDPLASGAGFDMRELNSLMHFVPVNGTDAEKGIAKGIQTALYSDVEHALKNTMGPAGKALADKWDSFKEDYRTYGNTLESKFVNIWDKVNSPTTLGPSS